MIQDNCTRPLGRPQGDTRGSKQVLSWGYKYYKVVKGVMVVIPKWKVWDLKVVYTREDCGACLFNHDQSCDNSKTMTKNKMVTFSPVLIPR